MQFKLKFEKIPISIGTYFYYHNGDEAWHWHVIANISDNNSVSYTWVAHSGMADYLASPLRMSMTDFLSDLNRGEFRIGHPSDERIPKTLKRDYAETKV